MRRTPPGKGVIVLLGDSLDQPNRMALRSGGPLQWNGRFEFVGHGIVDSAEGIDDYNFSYLLKFCKAFVHSARVIADMPAAPFWKPGDPYEQTGRKLYQKN